MTHSQPLDIFPLWLAYLLTVSLSLLAAEVGYRFGRAAKRRSPEEKQSTAGSMAGATLALLGFLLAIITGIAVNRFDARRQLVVDEANAIGTTYLRAGYVAEPIQSEIRELLREYVDARLLALEPGQLEEARILSEELHTELWARAEILAEESPTPVVAIFITSLNEVIDLHTKRITAALETRVPLTIWLGIYLAAFLSMSLVGYQNGLEGGRNLLPLLVLIVVFSAIILLILDLDRPQEGILRVSQQALIDLQQQIGLPAP
jgi:hypothetical protein